MFYRCFIPYGTWERQESKSRDRLSLPLVVSWESYESYGSKSQCVSSIMRGKWLKTLALSSVVATGIPDLGHDVRHKQYGSEFDMVQTGNLG